MNFKKIFLAVEKAFQEILQPQPSFISATAKGGEFYAHFRVCSLSLLSPPFGVMIALAVLIAP